MNNTPRRKLDDERSIPLIGMGTSRIIDKIMEGEVVIKENNIKDVIYQSIKDGVRLIDTAYKYGNEKQVGDGIKQALDENICKREELIIIGKVWLNFRNDPEKALRQTLKKLKLEYIDVYMDHWPSGDDLRTEEEIEKEKKKNPGLEVGRFNNVSIYEFWPKMEKLVELGLAKSLGVSNYNIQCLSNLLSFCTIKPVMNEIEYHLFYIQKDLKEFCEKENIAVIAYYPLPRGNGARMAIINNPEFDILNNDLIKKLVKKYKKTAGQIILNWHYCQGTIPIPSTSKTWRMKENLESLDFKLDDEDVKKLSKHFKQISLKRFCGCRRFFGVNVLA